MARVTPLRRLGGWIALLALALCVRHAAAQAGEFKTYGWAEADLALIYPSGWDAPAPVAEAERQILRLAQVFAADPAQRPPAADAITLIIVTDPNASDLSTYLASALAEQGTPWSGDSSGALIAGVTGSGATGRGGQLFGVARAARLDDQRVLVVAGRALIDRQDTFLALYDGIVSSIMPGADSTPPVPTYGVLWRVTESDGVPLGGITALALNGDEVVAVDATRGVVRLDAATGEITAAGSPNLTLINVVDAALDAQGAVWLADSSCGCIQVATRGGNQVKPLSNYSSGAPLSLTAAGDGTLYATNAGNMGIVVQAVTASGERTIPVGGTLAQPELAIDRMGRLLALTHEGALLALGPADRAFQRLFDLPMPLPLVTDMAVDLDNNLVLATADQGVLVVNSAGQVVEMLGEMVTGVPEAGQFVSPHGVAVGGDGTIYVADDGAQGSITAFSLRVAPERAGDSTLTPDHVVRGAVSAETQQQLWTFTGQRGQHVTISAVDASGADSLPLVLRLFAPDGTQERSTEMEDTALIADHELKQDGTYTVAVERVDTDGLYWLGLSIGQTFEVGADVVTLTGRLSEALPVRYNTFSGKHGETYTFTMRTTGGSLDPALSLVIRGGAVLAQNDDADDPALGSAAQLTHVTLPADGDYTLEMSRSAGSGTYQVTVVRTSE